MVGYEYVTEFEKSKSICRTVKNIDDHVGINKCAVINSHKAGKKIEKRKERENAQERKRDGIKSL